MGGESLTLEQCLYSNEIIQTLEHTNWYFQGMVAVIATHGSPGAKTKKWRILGVSLAHLVESRDLFFLEAEIVDNIFQCDVLKNMR